MTLCLMCQTPVSKTGETCSYGCYVRLIKYVRAVSGELPDDMPAPLPQHECAWWKEGRITITRHVENTDWRELDDTINQGPAVQPSE